MPHIIINAVLFQVLWFTAILTGWMWALIPLVLLVGHFLYRVRDTKVRLACAALVFVGICADAILTRLGVYSFADNTLYLAGLIPLWLSYMWIGFSVSLPLSLSWLFRSPLLLVAFFTVGGPLSYIAGRELGALAFANHDVWAIALTWFLVSLVVLAAQKWDGSSSKHSGQTVAL